MRRKPDSPTPLEWFRYRWPTGTGCSQATLVRRYLMRTKPPTFQQAWDRAPADVRSVIVARYGGGPVSTAFYQGSKATRRSIIAASVALRMAEYRLGMFPRLQKGSVLSAKFCAAHRAEYQRLTRAVHKARKDHTSALRKRGRDQTKLKLVVSFDASTQLVVLKLS